MFTARGETVKQDRQTDRRVDGRMQKLVSATVTAEQMNLLSFCDVAIIATTFVAPH